VPTEGRGLVPVLGEYCAGVVTVQQIGGGAVQMEHAEQQEPTGEKAIDDVEEQMPIDQEAKAIGWSHDVEAPDWSR